MKSREHVAGWVGRLPFIVSSVGTFLGLILLGELVILGLDPGYDGFRTGTVTSIPFILGFIYAGYWLKRSGIPPEQYGYIARWWIAGILGAVLVIGWINMSIQSISLQVAIGTGRWSGAIGGGIGVTVGILQARAVNKAVETERVRNQMEQAQQERDQLEEFTTIVSHDLKNPLHVAKARVALAREEYDSEDLIHAEKALTRMEELIDDLLTLARTGSEVSELEPVNLDSMAETCWEHVTTTEATLSVETDRIIQADRTRLKQLLENLMRNAAEHGGENVTVTVGSLEGGFYVEDDGSGIPENERSDVLEAGYSTTTDETGMGLRIVKQVAEAHGWDVHVTDGSDDGARFEITNVELSAS